MTQVGGKECGPAQVRAFEIGTGEVRPGQIGAAQVATPERRLPQIGERKFRTHTVRLIPEPTAVPLQNMTEVRGVHHARSGVVLNKALQLERFTTGCRFPGIPRIANAYTPKTA